MPDLDSKANKNNAYGAISADYCPPENIRVFHGRVHVSVRWLSARFRVSADLMRQVIYDLSKDFSLISDRSGWWVDDTAFYTLSTHPCVDHCFDEAARGAILQLLGHYRDMGGAA